MFACSKYMSFQERKRTRLLPWDLALTWEAVISSSSSSISTYVERSWDYGKGISRASLPATTTPTGRRTLNCRKGHPFYPLSQEMQEQWAHTWRPTCFFSLSSRALPQNTHKFWYSMRTVGYTDLLLPNPQSSRSCYLLLDQSLHSVLINYKTALVLNPGLTLEWLAALIKTLMLYPDQ